LSGPPVGLEDHRGLWFDTLVARVGDFYVTVDNKTQISITGELISTGDVENNNRTGFEPRATSQL